LSAEDEDDEQDDFQLERKVRSSAAPAVKPRKLGPQQDKDEPIKAAKQSASNKRPKMSSDLDKPVTKKMKATKTTKSALKIGTDSEEDFNPQQKKAGKKVTALNISSDFEEDIKPQAKKTVKRVAKKEPEVEISDSDDDDMFGSSAPSSRGRAGRGRAPVNYGGMEDSSD